MRTLKHIATYLLLGCAMSWFVAWGLCEIPRHLKVGISNRVQLVWTDQGVQRNVHLTQFRWFGIKESQYHEQRRSIYNAPPANIKVWWCWSPRVWTTPPPSPIETWKELSSTPALADLHTLPTVYSIVEYGFPAISTRVVGGIDDSVVLPDGSYQSRVLHAFTTPIKDPTRVLKLSTAPLAENVWMPYQPVWFGLVINSVFYAIVIAIIASILRTYRHARRMKRGKCPICNYELSFDFHDGCPECGWRKVAVNT